MEVDTLFIQTIPPDLTVGILTVPHHVTLSAIRTNLHETMEQWTVFNLEANTRRMCQDTITNTQQM